MEREEFQKAFGKIVAKAWTDEEFKAKLLADPATVFKDNGIEMPEGVEVKMVENTDKVVHFILPPPPAEGELSDDDLEKIWGVVHPERTDMGGGTVGTATNLLTVIPKK